MRLTRRGLIIGVAAGIAGSAAFWRFGGPIWRPIYYKIVGRRTVNDALSLYGPAADATLRALHDAAGLAYPPAEIAFIATKAERRLEVWARNADGPFKRLVVYDVLRASGKLGPKLREGDRQVPEGVYRISSLNPNSQFHLSMELNYPNAFDREVAARDGRTNLGGEIFIHGGFASIGCLAMGDPVIELLFVLVARVGRENVRVVIAPEEPVGNDFPTPPAIEVPWADDLHSTILEELRRIRAN